MKTNILSRSFSFSSPYIKGMKTFNDKINLKETVNDKRNLQRFLETQVKNGKFRSNLQRTAQYDNEFSNFLKEFQEKNKDSPTILDLSQYTRDNESFNKNFESRKEELIMLEEFRKRRQKQLKAGGMLGLKDQERILNDDLSDSDSDLFQETEGIGKEFEENDEEESGQAWSPSKRVGNFIYNRDEFVILMLHQNTTTLVTKLNRINHFRSLLFAGNGNGVIGYGKGKGNDFEESFRSAEKNLKQNLIAIPLDSFCPLTKEIRTHYNGIELRLMPRIQGMNAWGSPVVSHMLLLTGITNVKFKLIFRNMNPYALVYAYFKAMSQMRTPKELCEMEGVKIYRKHWGKPGVFQRVHTPDSLL